MSHSLHFTGGDDGKSSAHEARLNALRTILALCGITEPEEVSHGLLFRKGLLTYTISADTNYWLRVEVMLSDSRSPGVDPGHRLTFDTSSSAALIAAARQLNRRFLHVKFFPEGEHHLRVVSAFVVCGYALTHDLDGLDAQSRQVTQARAAFLLSFVTELLSFGIKEARLMLGGGDIPAPQSLIVRQQAPQPDSLVVMKALFARQKIAYVEVGTERQPMMVFSGGGFVYHIDFAGHAAGVFYITLRFLEEDRFVVGSTVENVIHAVIEDGLSDTCDSMNAKWIGSRAVLHEVDGRILIGLPCFLDDDNLDVAAEGLGLVIKLVRNAAQQLFESTATSFESFADANHRLSSVLQSEPGLLHISGDTRHSWERRSGRLMAEKITGQRGTLFSGQSVPDEKGEVEMDHILICEAGIFAIECKSHIGVIVGRRNGPWKHKLRGHSLTIGGTRGRNPADQSIQQVFALRRLFELHSRSDALQKARLFVTGIILFPSNTTLQLENVPTNVLAGNAPAAFNLDAFIKLLCEWPHPRPLQGSQVETLSDIIRAL